MNIRGDMDVPGTSAEHREDNPAQDEERVRAVREAVGDAVELMVDANCLMKYDAAVRWCKRLEPYNIMWFEEPIVHNDAHTFVRAAPSNEHSDCGRGREKIFTS